MIKGAPITIVTGASQNHYDSLVQFLNSLKRFADMAFNCKVYDWHAGGKHWASQEAPEWQTLAKWVQGQFSR